MNNIYDVIIIGSGVGGLVCGCYLSQAGLKVLVIEKNEELGGYCRSFTKDGFTFNTCIRGFVGCKRGGLFDKILTDLSLKEKIQILRPEVYDEIQFFDKSIAIHNNIDRTISEIIEAFPSESMAIKRFWSLLTKEDLFSEFYKYKNYTFQQFIDEYFVDRKLKFFLSALRIDSGEIPSKTSALADLMLIRGNVLDGGYFPKGGMSALPDLFAKSLIDHGGEILSGTLVTKILINKERAVGVQLASGKELKSRVVVSNSDARYTYNVLLKDARIKKNVLKKINSMIPATALFVVYVAVATSLRRFLRCRCAAVWNFSGSIGDGIVCTLPSVVDTDLAPVNSDSVTMYYGMPFKDQEYWVRNKDRIVELFMSRFFRVFPVKEYIKFFSCSTPIDQHKDTLNYRASSRGWAPTIKQITGSFPTHQTPVKNVFFVGHWVTSLSGNGGVTFVAQAGKKVAKLITNNWCDINK